MKDPVYQGFLRRQYEEATALAFQSDVVSLRPMPGSPPDKYLAEFRCRGLVREGPGEPTEYSQLLVGIWLPEDYLRRVDPAQILTYLGPSPSPWHPNFRPPFICAHIPPATPLTSLLHLVFDLWTYNKVSVGDNGLNPAAAAWYRAQDPARFPLERRPLKRRELRFDSAPVTEAPPPADS